LDAAPFHELAARAEAEDHAGLLFFVEDDMECAALLEVVEVEWRADIPDDELEEIETEEGRRRAVLHATGLTAAEVLRGRAGWSRPDIEAFRRFLQTPRIAGWVVELRDLLVSLRGRLTDRAVMWPHPTATLPRRPGNLVSRLHGG
jgi:hypothetical protein